MVVSYGGQFASYNAWVDSGGLTTSDISQRFVLRLFAEVFDLSFGKEP